MKAPLLVCGYVARAHGLTGEVAVRTFDPQSTALGEVRHLFLSKDDAPPKRYRLMQLGQGGQGDLLVRLAGVKAREAAQALVGSTVLLAREELAPPEGAEVFLGDLVGLEARSEQGVVLGTVAEVWSNGPVPNVVIRQGGAELIVPFAEDFVVAVDVDGGSITVRPPELLE